MLAILWPSVLPATAIDSHGASIRTRACNRDIGERQVVVEVARNGGGKGVVRE